MASIFTGLAFMHGHIVNRELVLRLGRDETVVDRGAGAAKVVATPRKDTVKTTARLPGSPACATC
ncbi:hypothetical protein QFZ41_002308 [Luteibacter sp. W1I16]|uniref:hypothetical protein n=1 Tax=Luteibacter sp. W1I16 TaxID=3373922 RepID=UPI003D1C2A7A